MLYKFQQEDREVAFVDSLIDGTWFNARVPARPGPNWQQGAEGAAGAWSVATGGV